MPKGATEEMIEAAVSVMLRDDRRSDRVARAREWAILLWDAMQRAAPVPAIEEKKATDADR
jgi:hypothetical protein